MTSMPKKLKYIMHILIGLFLLVGSIFLVLTPAGKRCQVPILGTYIPADATAVEVFTSEYEFKGRSAGNHIHECRVYMKVKYVIDNQLYFGEYVVKNYPYYERKAARIFAKNFMSPGTPLTIYRDPKKPKESVWHREDEEHLVLDYSTLLVMTIGLIYTLFTCALLFEKEQPPVTEEKT